jgi:hypothetical protein
MQPPSPDPKLYSRGVRLSRDHNRMLDELLAHSGLSFTEWVRANIEAETARCQTSDSQPGQSVNLPSVGEFADDRAFAP